VSSQTARQIQHDPRDWPGRVLVGFDGSVAARSAVDWAIREVAARGSSLRIGSCQARPCLYDGGSADLQRQRLLRLLRDIHDEHANLVVDLTTTQSDPRQALIEEAESSDLLVLASSADQSAEAVLLSSLARTALRRSPCPVVVVRGPRTGPVRHIVLGVDGSAAAGVAIDWACAEANLHRADLLVVHSRESDVSRAEAGCVLDLAVNRCRKQTSATVRSLLSERPPAAALIEASRSADLVAVGSRGRSGFRTAVFGSVALSVAAGASCPVAVTHPTMNV